MSWGTDEWNEAHQQTLLWAAQHLKVKPKGAWWICNTCGQAMLRAFSAAKGRKCPLTVRCEGKLLREGSTEQAPGSS